MLTVTVLRGKCVSPGIADRTLGNVLVCLLLLCLNFTNGVTYEDEVLKGEGAEEGTQEPAVERSLSW